ncbi:hypothetical protein TWF102_006247 [Orbilia oligospora]|uniref:Uncharacterized protein n=1 Tax=Orbilia oligospora TaxID=2813651 RepID=A0A7C8JWP2_ORBOL|nr:hypothetical protein TWF102_006247 [Orbilia oligospora]KAF3102181.1 hypothetical protein TWF706_005336 [Orbilia oligospora]KAF3112623.1 hypothetical protein TWF103_002864 [Orbilia oligospora]KAF3122323.1 hypothetical protein TWF594_002850 [Orbilia oligospora]KAF3130057.1 hypothetical protein TWF703_008396 [Orbilia oligospora]
MLRSKSRAGLGFERPLNDKTQGGDDNKENKEENANNLLPSSPGGLSMRHKIKQSFTNLALRLTPKETKTIFRKPSPSAQASKAETETAATVPLPESPRSGTPPLNTNPSPADSPAKSPSKPKRYLSFSFTPESKDKMDSKAAKFLLATARLAGKDSQKSDSTAKGKGKAPARDDAEAKSPASTKKEEVAGQTASTSPLRPPTATSSLSTQGAGKENQPTVTTTNDNKAKGMNKLKAKNKKKPATPATAPQAATTRPPTPIPRSVLALPAPERQEGSDLTNQITNLLGRLSAGETIDYQLRNPEGYVDDDPDCLDFLDDPECQEILGNTTPRLSSAFNRSGKKGRK